MKRFYEEEEKVLKYLKDELKLEENIDRKMFVKITGFSEKDNTYKVTIGGNFCNVNKDNFNELFVGYPTGFIDDFSTYNGRITKEVVDNL